MTQLAVRARVLDAGNCRLDVDLTMPSGSVVALIGPNGAGKSTLLKTVAGLINVGAGGAVLVGGHDVTAKSPAERQVAYVPQQGALFPHLSVLDNVAFGLRARGAGRERARSAAAGQLGRLEITDLADRRPGTLSGGQRQRVALARALVVEPAILLLDEPTSALDAVSRLDVQSLLRTHLQAFAGSTLLVTHDPAEALTIASRVVVLVDGLVVQDATPDELVRAPGSRWLAQLLNLNVWTGRAIDSSTVALDGGGPLVATDVPPPGTPLLICAAPTSIMLLSAPTSVSARNVWPVDVVDVHTLGGRVRITLRASDPGQGPAQIVAEVTTAAVADLAIAPGTRLWASVKASELAVTRL